MYVCIFNKKTAFLILLLNHFVFSLQSAMINQHSMVRNTIFRNGSRVYQVFLLIIIDSHLCFLYTRLKLLTLVLRDFVSVIRWASPSLVEFAEMCTISNLLLQSLLSFSTSLCEVLEKGRNLAQVVIFILQLSQLLVLFLEFLLSCFEDALRLYRSFRGVLGVQTKGFDALGIDGIGRSCL